MPVKKIFQVEVDDSQFKNFKSLFDRYQAAVAKLPQDWQKVAVAAGGVAEAHRVAAASAERQATSIEKQATALNSANRSSDSISQNWRSIAVSAHNLDKTLERSVVKMAKWGALAGGVLGGLAGVGTLFGIDRLAGSIASTRRQAMGLGISYGQQQAYNVNYSRLVNPGDIMSNISTAKYSNSSDQYVGLLGAGISQKDIAGKNPAQLFTQLMHNLPGMFSGVPEDQIGTYAHGYKLDNVISVPDIIRYLHASPEERSKIESDTQKDSKDMDLQDSVQKSWQDLVTQIGRATETVKSHFMNRLADIEPQLEKLSGEISGMVVKLVDSGIAKTAINWLGVELDKFAKYVGKKEFQDDILNFTKWVGDAASALWKFVSYFTPIGTATMGDVVLEDGDGSYIAPSGGAGGGYDPVTGKRSSGGDGPSSPGLTTNAQNAAGLRMMDYLVKERGWTPEAAAIAAGNAQQESSFNPNGPAGDPSIPGGSHGLFQWNRDRLVALKAYAEKTGHAWTEERTQQEFFANESERKIPNWKSERGFDSAGNISHRYEGYGDNSTGTRVANAREFLKRYNNRPAPFHAPEHPHSIVIQKQAGANVPRSMFSIAQPYANATQPS